MCVGAAWADVRWLFVVLQGEIERTDEMLPGFEDQKAAKKSGKRKAEDEAAAASAPAEDGGAGTAAAAAPKVVLLLWGCCGRFQKLLACRIAVGLALACYCAADQAQACWLLLDASAIDSQGRRAQWCRSASRLSV